MTDQATEQRASFLAQPFVWLEQRDIQDIRDRNVLRYLFLFFLGAVSMSVLFWALQHWPSPLPDASENTRNFFEWVNGLLQNAGTEFLGAFVTFYLIETLLRKRRGDDERKDREKLQREVAKEIRDELRGYIQAQELARLRAAETPEERQPILDSMKATGLLEGANLNRANLQGATLQWANLQGAKLEHTNLEEAFLGEGNLQRSNLQNSNLEGVFLRKANLEGTVLHEANLQRSSLVFANLEGALLLTIGQLHSADSLEGATLPDGHRLPDDGTWKQAFEHWVQEVAQLKEIDRFPVQGIFIIPTRTGANAVVWKDYYGDEGE